jgi:hypothetical protein
MTLRMKKPGFPGFFIFGVLGSDTVCHLVLAQNRNVFWNLFSWSDSTRGGMVHPTFVLGPMASGSYRLTHQVPRG